MSSRTPDVIERWVDSIRGRTCLRSNLKVYAPTCHGKCKPTVKKLVNDMNQIFGGTTTYEAVGSWNENGRVETEPVVVIESGHHCTDPVEARKFAKALNRYARDAKQRSIAISAGNFYIASTPRVREAYERIR